MGTGFGVFKDRAMRELDSMLTVGWNVEIVAVGFRNGEVVVPVLRGRYGRWIWIDFAFTVTGRHVLLRFYHVTRSPQVNFST